MFHVSCKIIIICSPNQVERIEPMDVVCISGKFVGFGNRRLHCFKEYRRDRDGCAVKIKVRFFEKVSNQKKKMSTQNEGTSVEVLARR